MKIIHGDCLIELPKLADCSIDAIVTDPPYGLKFMGKAWDGGDIAFQPDTWRECLRVLKPGGHMAVFGSARTHHRVWCAIEDAGFEIRDTIMWLTAQGFPKSLNVAKSIQSHKAGNGHRFDNRDMAGATAIGLPGDQWIEAGIGIWSGRQGEVTDSEALEWQGWHSNLKPAHEPICLARKPLMGTIAQTVLAYGTGALNIDACRVGSLSANSTKQIGRWPADLIHDGSEEVEAAFAQFGDRKSCNSSSKACPEGSILGGSRSQGAIYPGENGSASRFFFHAKASKADRCGSKHPTVKPIALMEWLCKLICPPDGVILDPFAGSGTTGAAALNCGFGVILIEREAEYVADIQRRVTELIEFVD